MEFFTRGQIDIEVIFIVTILAISYIKYEELVSSLQVIISPKRPFRRKSLYGYDCWIMDVLNGLCATFNANGAFCNPVGFSVLVHEWHQSLIRAVWGNGWDLDLRFSRDYCSAVTVFPSKCARRGTTLFNYPNKAGHWLPKEQEVL